MLHRKLGSHPIEGRRETRFSVWAPNAQEVGVMGDFSDWNEGLVPLARDGEGIWQGIVSGVESGSRYKYRVKHRSGEVVDKADPLAFYSEVPPRTASIVWETDYRWGDKEWEKGLRRGVNSLRSPISIYEVHLGSWRRDERGEPLPYWELAEELPSYVKEMGFTHVELLPVMEHPFYGSWGYQVTGFFAPSARYGNPQDFMHLVDSFHAEGVGVVLDWVPSHFPSDAHSLAFFDGTSLYEYGDPNKRIHPDWRSYVFDYSKGEVRSFLSSSASFWLDVYHADALRVDGVASMLYLDYSRRGGDWTRNEHGGRENLEAVSFLQTLNREIYRSYPNSQTIAEESTAWPGVTRPVESGGLGFGLKWKMGWMHDTLRYFSKDPIYRKHHQELLTFSMWYAYAENFVLPLSHDEVVYGKGSLLQRMPGDRWQKFANLRLLFGYMFAHPGKKLLWMGNEFGQAEEWHHDGELQWRALLSESEGRGVGLWVKDLNTLYRRERALHELDFYPGGFSWISYDDSDQSVVAFLRRSGEDHDVVLVILNFTPIVRHGYLVGVPMGGRWVELLNSDGKEYGGSGVGNAGGVETLDMARHGMDRSLRLALPPLGVLFLKPEVEPNHS
jgi:1,4-alpha-glucan branching enzyme